MKGFLLAWMAVLVSFSGGDCEADVVAEAVERSLPWLEEEGTWWIEKKECVSCHHTTFLVWAKDLALEAGLPVDGEILAGQRRWVWEEFLSPRESNDDEAAEPAKEGGYSEGKRKGDSNIEGVAQLLVSPSGRHAPTETRRELAGMILSNRKDDGNWAPGGQLPRQKRPAEETGVVSNQWALAALRAEGLPEGVGDPRQPDDFAAKTTEWFAMDALLEEGGVGRGGIGSLLARQNEDGGWSWIEGEGSGPMATGLALLALGRGEPTPEVSAAIARGRDYLVENQEEDGHWETISTKDRGKSTRVSDFWGTAWAVIGLLESREKEASP